MKKALILLLSALLLITPLAGCGAVEEQEPEAEAAEYDWDAAYAKFSPDTVVMSINGSEVHWDEYFYWMYREYASYAAGYDLSDGVPGYDDTLIGEYIAAAAADFCLQNHIAEQLAGGLGITLTEEDEAVLAERLASDIETNLGEGATEEEFFDYLETVYVSRELYDYVNRTAALYARVFMELYGSMGEKVSDEDALAFAEEYGFITAKHILLRTTDDSGAALSEGERESKLSEANDILAELRAVPEADREALFTELMNERSEDPGLERYPDGYCFEPGTVVEEFQTAAEELEIGGISDVVESASGYHIIMREPVTPDDKVLLGTSEVYTLRYACAVTAFNESFTAEMAGAEVVYGEGFEGFNAAELFE